MSDAKLITLTLDGDLGEGYRVTFLGPDHAELRGTLPANLALSQALQIWRQAYQTLPVTTRITPREILYEGSLQAEDHCRQASAGLKSEFADWLNSPEFAPIDRRLRECLTPNQSMQLLLRSDDWDLYRLPWHHWEFVDQHPQVSISFSPLARQAASLASQPNPQVRILAIFGSPVGLDLSADRQALETLPNTDLTLLIEPNRSQLNDTLWDRQWDIICFSGHSQTQAQEGRFWINTDDHLSLDELRYGLRQAKANGLKLAVFNSCDGLGLAKDLLALHLPQIVVMREPIPDAIAHHFLIDFLAGYSSGQSLCQAHRRAQERLQGLEKDYPCASWLPILFENEPAIAWAEFLSSPAALQGDRKIPWPHLLLAGVIGSVLSIGLRGVGLLESFELQALDQFTRTQSTEISDDRLLLITIDDEDIRYQEQQGMSLSGTLAPEALQSLIPKLQALEPISIGLDLYRSKPWGLPENLPLFSICKVPAPEGGDPFGVDPAPDINPNLIGFSDFIVDQDDRLRRQLIAIKNTATTSNCGTQNSLNLLLAIHYLQTRGYQYELNAQKEFDWGTVVWSRLMSNAGGYHQVDAAGYQLLLRYRASPNLEDIAPTLPLRELLQNQVPAPVLAKLKNKIILIGTTASSTSDRWRSPLHKHLRQSSPGVYLQAQMVSQLMSSVEDQRSLIRWWPEWTEILWISAWGLAVGLIYRLPYRTAVGASFATGGILSAICYVGFIQAWWLPWIPTLLCVLLTSVLVSLQKYRQSRPFV